MFIPMWLFIIICVLLSPYLFLAIGVCVYMIAGIHDITYKQKDDNADKCPYFTEGKQ